jgi:hypothetical protein
LQSNKQILFISRLGSRGAKFNNMSTGYEIKTRISEIASDLEDGKPRQEVIKEYCEKWGVCERTLKRYMAFASDLLASRMDRRDVLLDAMRAEYIDECMEKTMRTTLELEARLCEIAEGAIELERKVHTRTGIVDVKQKPSYTNMLYAIDRILRMRGCYDAKARKANEPHPQMKIVLHNQKDYDLVKKMQDDAKSDAKSYLT